MDPCDKKSLDEDRSTLTDSYNNNNELTTTPTKSMDLNQQVSCFSIEPNLSVIPEEDEEKTIEIEGSQQSSVINVNPVKSPAELWTESTSQLSLASFSPNAISRIDQLENSSVVELLELSNRKSRTNTTISSESLDAKFQKCLRANKTLTSSPTAHASNTVTLKNKSSSTTTKTRGRACAKESKHIDKGNRSRQPSSTTIVTNAPSKQQKLVAASSSRKIQIFGSKLRNIANKFDNHVSPYSCEFTPISSSKKGKEVPIKPRDDELIKFKGSLRSLKAKQLQKPELRPTVFGWVPGPNRTVSSSDALKGHPKSPLRHNGNSHQNFRQDLEAMADELIQSLKSHRTAMLKDVSQVTSNNLIAEGKESQCIQTSASIENSLGNENFIGPCFTSQPQTLESLLSNMQLGIYSASEASVVLMNTVFNGALADPKSAQIIMEQPGFRDFIMSENEIDALRKASVLFATAASSITNYLHELKGAGLSFPEKTNFTHKSTQILNIPMQSIGVMEDKSVTLKNQAPGITLWNFKDKTPEKFNISLAHQNGKVIQTTTFHNQKFSIEFLGSECRVRSLTAASHVQQVPAELSPAMILEIIDRASSFAVARLQAAKYLLSVPFPKLYAITINFQGRLATQKLKKWGLKRLKNKVQSHNILAGLVMQALEGLLRATALFIAAIRNSIEVAEILEFPRIPGMHASNRAKGTEKNILCEEHICGIESEGIQIPVTGQVPLQDAHHLINNGLKELNLTVESCKDSVASLTSGRKIKKPWLRIVKSTLQSMETLQMNHNVEFGTLLMTLACNVTVLKTMENIIPTLNASLRRKIMGNISGLGGVVTEYQKMARKMRFEASVLGAASMRKLKEIKDFENMQLQPAEPY